jgi:hypothetical protein
MMTASIADGAADSASEGSMSTLLSRPRTITELP